MPQVGKIHESKCEKECPTMRHIIFGIVLRLCCEKQALRRSMRYAYVYGQINAERLSNRTAFADAIHDA